MTTSHSNQSDEHHTTQIPITIDKVPFKAPKTPMTGAELRALPEPDVASDRDLWLEVPGPSDDLPITPTTVLDLRPGMHFYTAPKTINPGAYSHGTP
jgi:hypothetical protein